MPKMKISTNPHTGAAILLRINHDTALVLNKIAEYQQITVGAVVRMILLGKLRNEGLLEKNNSKEQTFIGDS